MVTYWVGDDKLTAKKNDAFEKKMRRRSTLEFNFDDDDTTTDIQLETAPLNEKTEKHHNLTKELSLGSKGKETFGMNGVEEKAWLEESKDNTLLVDAAELEYVVFEHAVFEPKWGTS